MTPQLRNEKLGFMTPKVKTYRATNLQLLQGDIPKNVGKLYSRKKVSVAWADNASKSNKRSSRIVYRTSVPPLANHPADEFHVASPSPLHFPRSCVNNAVVNAKRMG